MQDLFIRTRDKTELIHISPDDFAMIRVNQFNPNKEEYWLEIIYKDGDSGFIENFKTEEEAVKALDDISAAICECAQPYIKFKKEVVNNEE